MTFIDMFKHEHPSATLDDDGMPKCCPFHLGYEREADRYCNTESCECNVCWKREVSVAQTAGDHACGIVRINWTDAYNNVQISRFGEDYVCMVVYDQPNYLIIQKYIDDIHHQNIAMIPHSRVLGVFFEESNRDE